MPTDLASLEDFAARLSPGLELDQIRAQAALDDAANLALSVAGAACYDEGGEPLGIVTTIVLSVARRAYENPGGLVQETAGPFSGSRAQEAGQILYLTATERQALERLNDSGGLWVLRTTRQQSAALPDVEFLDAVYADGRQGERIPFRQLGDPSYSEGASPTPPAPEPPT